MLHLWVSGGTFTFYDSKSSSPGSWRAFVFVEVYFVFVRNTSMFSSIDFLTFLCLLLGFLFFVPNVNGNSACPHPLTACCLRIGGFQSCAFILCPDIRWNFLVVCNVKLGSLGIESHYLHMITLLSFQFYVYIFPFEYLLGPMPPEEFKG